MGSGLNYIILSTRLSMKMYTQFKFSKLEINALTITGKRKMNECELKIPLLCCSFFPLTSEVL